MGIPSSRARVRIACPSGCSDHDSADAHGNVVVPEDRVRAALMHASEPEAMLRELDLALGQAWDDELEPFRYAGSGAPVRWLHRVG